MDKETIKQNIISVWRTNEGFFENLFRIGTYIMPFIPGLGWLWFIIDKILSVGFQAGLEDAGAKLDKVLGLAPGSDISESAFMGLESKIEELNKNSRTMYQNGQIVKQAFLFGLLKTVGIKRILKISWDIINTSIKFLLLLFGVSALPELNKKIDEYKAQLSGKATEMAGQALQKTLFDGQQISDLKGILS